MEQQQQAGTSPTTGEPQARRRPQDCDVCLLVYEDLERRPRTLPCGHTFCSRCVAVLLNDGRLSCPSCRADHLAPNADHFPISYGFEALVKELQAVSHTMEGAAAREARLSVTRPPTFELKPKDIRVLKLHELHGLEAASRLNMFFDQVESCSSQDVERVQIGRNRVDTQLAYMLQYEASHNQLDTWTKFKTLLTTQFYSDVTFDTAWEELLHSQIYKLADHPQAFSHKVICQYALMAARFPKEKLPNRDKLIKHKLIQGMPQDSRKKLLYFVGGEIPLNNFIDRLEHERQKHLSSDPF